VAYQRILQLTYIDDLLTAMKRLFVHYFEPILTAFVASLHAINATSAALQNSTWDFKKSFKNWDLLFDKLLKELEEKAASV
jgi:signal recognition particle receptor subunit alpha